MPDKTIVQVPVTKAHLKDVHLYLSATGDKTWSASYVPKDAAGIEIGEPRAITGLVGNEPDLFAWVDRVVIPAINTLEQTA